jgi:hypothetical protein
MSRVFSLTHYAIWIRRKARREFALIVEGAVMNSFTLHQNVFFTKAMQSELVLKR